jgi:hypothetical protein
MILDDTLDVGSHMMGSGIVFHAQIGAGISAHGINSWKRSNRRLPFSALQ